MKAFLVAAIGLTGILFSLSAFAGRTEKYYGEAKSAGKLIYIERHVVEYDDNGRVLSAQTRYENPNGIVIAELNSDFTASLVVPNHRIQDFRTQEIQGLRRENGKIVLFYQEQNKPEKIRILSEADAEDRILIGCQGLNYYLLANLGSSALQKTLPLRFLIPGRLDFYDFDMKPVGQPKGDIQEFEMQVKHWLLKLFAPHLRVKYNQATKHIVWYEGISNITDDRGGNQKVVIDYVYEKDNPH